ncbi:hypothetical protein DYB32_006256 [Aphanomyces invadans]|nr:hypothetical protein DYB32_006256 [Aphanomyces invadans]
MLLTDPAYWRGVAAMDSLFKTISCCLTYLEGDEATFSAVYACFFAIKYHIKTLDLSVMEALHLNDDDICEMIRLIHHRFSTIYSEAHALVFCTDPLFTSMHRLMGFRFDEKFLHLGKGSINQQSKTAIALISMGNEILRRSMLSEFAVLVTRQQDTEDDFSDTSIKPSVLWTVCDESSYGSLSGPLSALHQNPTGASGGERNHKATRRVHTKNRARMGHSKIESGTAILFNSGQLVRRLTPTRNTKFCTWLQQLGADDEGLPVEEEALDEEEDAAADALIEEFDHVHISDGLEGVMGNELFDEEVMDEGSIFYN